MDVFYKIQAILNLLEEVVWVYSTAPDNLRQACQSLYDELRPFIYEDIGFTEILSIGDDSIIMINGLAESMADEWRKKLVSNWYDLKKTILVG